MGLKSASSEGFRIPYIANVFGMEMALWLRCDPDILYPCFVCLADFLYDKEAHRVMKEANLRYDLSSLVEYYPFEILQLLLSKRNPSYHYQTVIEVIDIVLTVLTYHCEKNDCVVCRN